MTSVNNEASRSRAWRALIGPAVSLGLLAMIALRLDLSAIGASLGQATVPTWLLAMALLGGGIFMGSLRWRLAARSAGLDVSFGLVVRAAICGTFYNLLLFGPAGGDIAKSATYARWYGLSLERLLSASIVDRGFSVGGSTLFLLAAVAALFAFGDVQDISLPGDGWDLDWLGPALMLLALLLVAAVAWRRRGAFLNSLVRIFRDTVKVVLKSPSVMARGCLHGFTQQLLMSSVFAATLVAVSSPDLPWLAMLWAFPLISAMTVVPFTFGGAGAREGLALLLLTPYGVEAEAIVAAGLLTLSIYLAWAGLGAAMVALEWRRHRVLKLAGTPDIDVLCSSIAMPRKTEHVRVCPERERSDQRRSCEE